MRHPREAVLGDHLFTLRSLIDRFTLDNGRAPARLEELVEKGYLGRIPTDPFRGSNKSWQKAEGSEQKAEGRKQKAESRGSSSWLVTSALGGHDAD